MVNNFIMFVIVTLFYFMIAAIVFGELCIMNDELYYSIGFAKYQLCIKKYEYGFYK